MTEGAVDSSAETAGTLEKRTFFALVPPEGFSPPPPLPPNLQPVNENAVSKIKTNTNIFLNKIPPYRLRQFSKY